MKLKHILQNITESVDIVDSTDDTTCSHCGLIIDQPEEASHGMHPSCYNQAKREYEDEESRIKRYADFKPWVDDVRKMGCKISQDGALPYVASLNGNVVGEFSVHNNKTGEGKGYVNL